MVTWTMPVVGLREAGAVGSVALPLVVCGAVVLEFVAEAELAAAELRLTAEIPPLTAVVTGAGVKMPDGGSVARANGTAVPQDVLAVPLGEPVVKIRLAGSSAVTWGALCSSATGVAVEAVVEAVFRSADEDLSVGSSPPLTAGVKPELPAVAEAGARLPGSGV
jgi:hypothetical protein